MIFHMLRWEMGDEVFTKFLRGLLSQYTDKGVRSSDVEKVSEAQSQQQLTPFFAQWVDGTGAPTFANKYTVFRLGEQQGISDDRVDRRRIWICSGCRWSCGSRPMAKRRYGA